MWIATKSEQMLWPVIDEDKGQTVVYDIQDKTVVLAVLYLTIVVKTVV